VYCKRGKSFKGEGTVRTVTGHEGSERGVEVYLSSKSGKKINNKIQ